MTYEEALKRVRAAIPHALVRTAWIFDGKYFFSVSQGKTFVVDDLTVITVLVDGKTGEIKTYGSARSPVDTADEAEGYRYFMALCADRPVDITEDQYRKLVEKRQWLTHYWEYQAEQMGFNK